MLWDVCSLDLADPLAHQVVIYASRTYEDAFRLWELELDKAILRHDRRVNIYIEPVLEQFEHAEGISWFGWNDNFDGVDPDQFYISAYLESPEILRDMIHAYDANKMIELYNLFNPTITIDT